MPYHRIQTLDQLSRRVLQRLTLHARALVADVRASEPVWARPWAILASFTSKKDGAEDDRDAEMDEFAEEQRLDFANRLWVSEWGSLMLGQERWFKDPRECLLVALVALEY